MMRNVRHHSLYRVMTLLVILSLFLPPQAVLAAPEAAPVQAPAQQSAGQGVIVGEVYHDATGLPLAGATITLLSVDGTAVSGPAVISDARGRYRLASAAGAARLRVTRPGYTTVERTATVTADRSAAAFDARLALLDPSGITVPSVVGGTVASADGSITLRVPAGALNGDTAIALTWLSAQGLAGLPPRGWSPVAAADVSPQPLAFGSPATLRMNLPADLPASTTAIAARWDVESGQWIALGQSNLTPAQTQIEVEISASGQFAVFLPDPAPNAPALPAAGQPLAGVTPAAAPADLTAEILPSSQVIFTASDARAPITVRTQGSTALTSGEPLQLTLNESYAFNDGSSLHPEPMVQDILVFAYPGTPTTPAANLMVAPSHVAEPHELRQGVIDLAVTLADMSGGPLALTNGLKLTGSNGEELSIPRRAADQQPVRFSGLLAAGFPLTLPSGMTFVHGFSVDLFGGRLGLPAALSAPIPASLPASAQVLAVRLVVVDGVSRLELTGPVSRSGGRLRFNGLTAEGRYAFISTATALGFVSGMVTGASGTALQGVLVSVPGQPFISITNPEGRYIVAGQPGTVEVNALDPQSYDAASKQAVISAAGSFTTLNLTLAALPPSVVGSAPVDQAVDIPLAGTVTITFSEPLAPLSTVNALVLSTASGPVNGAGTLSPDGLVLTYRPNALLASQTTYTATLAASVTDRSGNPMLAPYVITFRTVDVTPPPRPEPGQIQATIPNENGISFVTGSPGTAEPGQPVRVRVVRNSADTTVLANDDGSFQLEVQALLSDKLVLFIHDGAGNITEVAVPRFENPDGSVVVGSEGGIVSAPDGSYAEVEPGSLPDGTVVKVTPITEVELPAAAPVEFPFLAGVRLDLGPITPTHYIDLAVPAPPDAREDDIVLVTQPITLPNGTVAWKLIDRAHLENGKYVTASPPFPGALASATYSFFRPAYIIEPGPDGILQTEPRFASDDEVEQRPHPDGGTYEVIVGGSDGKLQTSPRESSDDVRRTECMSFVSMSSSFKLEVQIFTPMVPPFIVPSSGIDQVTLVGYCNQPLEVQVVDSGTGELLEAISVTAPAARNEILYPGTGLTDDHEAPFVVGTILPTNMIEQSPEVYLKFNEAMLAETLVNNFKVRDSRGYAVAGAVDVLFRNTVAVFRPRVAFRLDEEFTIDLTGVTDFAGNPVQSAPLKFKRTAPHSLGEFRDSPEIFDALAVCADQNDPDSCAISPRDVATLGNTAFLANGLGWPYQYYKDQVNQRRIAVLDTSNPTAPKIIGWYRTVTVPRSVAVLPDVAFNYISVDGSNARFEGDLLIVTGGGIGGNTSARLEIYDVTACFQRTPGVTNCLDESLQPFKGAKFMSTGLNNTQYQGVPPDPGSAAELEILHQRVIKQSDEAGPQRQDTVIAYSVIVPVGIVAVDITKAFNAGSTKPDRYAIDGLYRGDFYDLSVVKNLVVAGENPSSGSPKMRVFDVSLVPLEEVPVPRAFRVATGENFIVDLDNDGNLGAGEDNDNDTITGRDELFDLAFVTSGGRATTWGRGDLYVLDLSKRTDLQHPEPLRDADNLSEDPRIISRIPLPGPAFDVCIDMLSQLAYVALDGVGLAVVDLSHLTGVIRDGQSGRWLIDDNGDFVDDRVLYIFRHETQPVQYLLGFDCRDPNLAEDPNANQRPAYAPAQPGTLVLNWEQTGSQILGNFAVIAESPVVIKSDYDLVNQAVCEPLEYLEFFLSHPATVTVTIDGAVIKVDEDFVEPENDQVDEGLIDFANIRLAAGAHRYPIPVDAVTDMGDHPFQVKAVFMPGDPGVVMTADGIVRHELSMKANLPIGHTMVKNVDLWDGHLVHSSQDIRIPGRGPSLEFNRTYSSGGVEFSGLLGAGWSHNLNVRLVYDNCGKYVVIGGEGSGNAFTNPQRDDAKRQLYSRPGFVLDENVEFFQPQIGYHSTLVRDPDDLNKFDFFTKSFVRYHFEREGMLPGEVYTLRFIEDANGNRLTFDYVSGDQDPTTLDNVTDDAGRKLRFHYALVADSKRIVKVEGIVSPDPNLPSAAPNIEMLYGYDTIGNLVAVTRTTPYAGLGLNDERVERYGYSVGHPVDKFNLTSYTDPNGNTTTFEYYAESDPIEGYTPDFLVAKHEFIKAVHEPEGITTSFYYTISTSVQQPNLRAVSDPRPGVPPTVYTLDAYGATVQMDAPLGATTRFGWCTSDPLPAECNGKRDAIKVFEIDPLGRKKTFVYDDLGNVVQETTALGNVSAPHIKPVKKSDGQIVSEIVVTYTYDPLFSKMTSKTDAENHTTWYCLDSPTTPPAGSPCQATSGKTGNQLAAYDALGNKTVFTYDTNGDLLSVTDPNGFKTTYAYDAYGNPGLTVDPLGNQTVDTYDARSRLLESYDTFGHHIRYGYDGLDRRILEEQLDDRGDRGPAQVTVWRYLPNGEEKTVTIGLTSLQEYAQGKGHKTEYFYDGMNRMVRAVDYKVEQADGTTIDLEARYGYDQGGYQTLEITTRGITQTYGYDALGRLLETRVKGPYAPGEQTVSAATYDAAGNKLTETDLHGNTTTFTYDALYRVIETRLPFQHSFTDVPQQQAVILASYDLVGNMLTQSDANGHLTTYVYDPVYRVARQIDPLGNVAVFTYDGVGNKVRVESLTSGLVQESAFDGLNRTVVSTQTVPLAGPGLTTAVYVSRYEYRDAQNAVIVTNPRGVKTLTDHDGLDRIVRTVVDYSDTGAPGKLNLETKYTYDANGNIATIQDPQGGDIDVTYKHDALNRKILATYVATADDGGQAVTEQFFYDGAGNVIKLIDKRKIEQRWSYDNLGRELTHTMVESISNGGNELVVSSMIYNDAADGQGRYTVTMVDANGNESVVTYDSLGREVLVDDPDPNPNAVVRTEYDGVNKRSVTDKNGNRVEFVYDSANRRVTTREHDAAGVLRVTTTTAYDDAQRRVTSTDGRGIQTVTQQDALGRVVQVKRSGLDMADHYGAAEVVLETYEYDADGNLVKFVDGRGNVTLSVFDGANRRTAVTEGAGSSVEATTTFTHDRVGNVLTVKDGRDHGGAFDFRYEYDARYRMVRATNGENETLVYGYDAANNRVRTVEPNGAAYTTLFVYDEFNRLLAVDETPRVAAGAAAGVTRFFYDANRNKIAQQDANGNLVTYIYDSLNRLTDMYQHTAPGTLSAGTVRGSDPRGSQVYAAIGGNQATALRWHYEYDANGNQTVVVDARGQQATIAYDFRDRPVNRAYSNVADATLNFQVQSIAYAYDNNDNPVSITETKWLSGAVISEVTTFVYDPLDRLQARTRKDHDDLAGKSAEFDYDLQGNRTAVTDPDGITTTYQYDARNRLEEVVTEAGVTRYTWWPDNLLKLVTYPNFTVQDRSAANAYDKADRLLQVNNGRTGPSIAYSTYAYTYDDNGNRLQQIELQKDLGGGQPVTTTYSYDGMNRVVAIDYGAAGNMSYTYAANGNRLTEQGVDPRTGQPADREFVYGKLPGFESVTYDNVNTLTRIEDRLNPAQSITYEYDANLNQTAKVQNGVRTLYKYDVRDQIAAAIVNGETTEFDYDHDRMRVKKIGPQGETRYFYDESAVLTEYGGAAESLRTLRKYDYGHNLLALTEINGSARDSQFYLVDGLGSTANLAGEDGALVQSLRYDAWGRVLEQNGTAYNLRRYTGHYYDEETGLHYFGARYYDDEIGRFLSQDPFLGDPGTPPSLHRYLYAYANPLRFVDRDGYESTEANGGMSSQSTYSAELSTYRRGGYTEMKATGRTAEGLASWLNGESRNSASETQEDIVGGWGGEKAREIQKWHQQRMKELDEFVQEDPGLGRVIWATVESIGPTFLAETSDILRLGEGCASGTVSGCLQDVFRVVDAFSFLHGFASGSVKLLQGGVKWLAGGKQYVNTYIKLAGKRYMPTAFASEFEENVMKSVLGERFIMGVRAADPLTARGSQKLMKEGITPKPLEVKAKSGTGGARWGEAVAEEIHPELGRVTTHYRSDQDIAWVWDRKEKRFLKESEVETLVVRPMNQKLPPEMKFMHNAHFTAPKEWSGAGGGGTLDWDFWGSKAGHPGPVAVYDGRGYMYMQSEATIGNWAKHHNLPWHESWDTWVEKKWKEVGADTSAWLNKGGQGLKQGSYDLAKVGVTTYFRPTRAAAYGIRAVSREYNQK